LNFFVCFCVLLRFLNKKESYPLAGWLAGPLLLPSVLRQKYGRQQQQQQPEKPIYNVGKNGQCR